MTTILPPATASTVAQRGVELTLLRFLSQYRPAVRKLWENHPDANLCENFSNGQELLEQSESADDADEDCFLWEMHGEYLRDNLVHIPSYAQRFYNAQPWIVYWTLQAAETLGITGELYDLVPPEVLGGFLLGCLEAAHTDEGSSECGGTCNHWDQGDVPHHCCGVLGSKAVLAEDGERALGFSGGRIGQIPHLATSYAAVCSLCIIGQPEYLKILPRAAIKRWLLSLRRSDGSFCMHLGGEADIRASYCVAVIVTLLQLHDVGIESGDVLTSQTAEFVASCQTHEGGFACGKFASEAHGAYTQCGLAALILMGKPHMCNYATLRGWLSARQLSFEGGFNGRTNKLVDSCYAHWVGASHVLLRIGEALVKLMSCTTNEVCITAREMLLLDHAQFIDTSTLHMENHDSWQKYEEDQKKRADRVDEYVAATPLPPFSVDQATSKFLDEEVGDFYFNQRRLQVYILKCCQNKHEGGLMDKPKYPNDPYHTCYSISGLSSAQNLQYIQVRERAARCRTEGDSVYAVALRQGYIPGHEEHYGIVLPHNVNTDSDTFPVNKTCLEPTNPIFNIKQSSVLATLRVWGGKTLLL